MEGEDVPSTTAAQGGGGGVRKVSVKEEARERRKKQMSLDGMMVVMSKEEKEVEKEVVEVVKVVDVVEKEKEKGGGDTKENMNSNVVQAEGGAAAATANVTLKKKRVVRKQHPTTADACEAERAALIEKMRQDDGPRELARAISLVEDTTQTPTPTQVVTAAMPGHGAAKLRDALSRFVEGSRLPLTQLTAQFCETFERANTCGVSTNAVRNVVFQVATRRSYGGTMPYESASSSEATTPMLGDEEPNVLEDVEVARLWRWDLLDFTKLAFTVEEKDAIDDARHRAKLAQERLLALEAALVAFRSHDDDAARTALKASTGCDDIDNAVQYRRGRILQKRTSSKKDANAGAGGVLADKTANATASKATGTSKKAASGGAAALAAKEAREAEKRAAKAAKEAERKAAKEAKEAEKEAARQAAKEAREAKEAEKEAARKAAQEAKEAREAEAAEKRALRQKEKEEKDSEKRAAKEAKEAERLAKEAEKLAKEAERQAVADAKLAKEQKSKEKLAKSQAAFANFFMKSSPPKAVDKVEAKTVPNAGDAEDTVKGSASLVAEMDERITSTASIMPADECVREFHTWCAGARGVSKFCKDASWQQRRLGPRCYIDGAIRISRTVYIEPSGRRRLLQFCENTRPAFYGTMASRVPAIRGRKPLARDDSLDYEVDSDDEWEEDPGGEDVQVSDADTDEEDVAGDDEEDGFMVPDGYLSDDELRAVAMDTDDKLPAMEPAGIGLDGGETNEDEVVDAEEAEKLKTVRQMDIQIETCRRQNRVLILCHNDPRSASAREADRFLSVLEVDVLDENALTLTALECRDGPGAGSKPVEPVAKTTTKKKPAKQPKPRRPKQFPEELVPALIHHLLGPMSENRKIDDCVGAFLAGHSNEFLSRRNVRDKMLFVATKEKGGWRVRDEILEQYKIEAPASQAQYKTPENRVASVPTIARLVATTTAPTLVTTKASTTGTTKTLAKTKMKEKTNVKRQIIDGTGKIDDLIKAPTKRAKTAVTGVGVASTSTPTPMPSLEMVTPSVAPTKKKESKAEEAREEEEDVVIVDAPEEDEEAARRRALKGKMPATPAPYAVKGTLETFFGKYNSSAERRRIQKETLHQNDSANKVFSPFVQSAAHGDTKP